MLYPTAISQLTTLLRAGENFKKGGLTGGNRLLRLCLGKVILCQALLSLCILVIMVNTSGLPCMAAPSQPRNRRANDHSLKPLKPKPKEIFSFRFFFCFSGFLISLVYFDIVMQGCIKHHHTASWGTHLCDFQVIYPASPFPLNWFPLTFPAMFPQSSLSVLETLRQFYGSEPKYIYIF